MQSSNRKNLVVGMVVGFGAAAVTGMLMGQVPNRAARPATEFFVTGDGNKAHLWERDGAALRCIGHGTCGGGSQSSGATAPPAAPSTK